MYEVVVEASFSSAHYLRNYQGSCENPHGHNWLVKAFVESRDLDNIGIAVDFRKLRALLAEVIRPLDHTELNTVFDRARGNPSSENIARYIFEKLKAGINDGRCRVSRVEVYETPTNRAAYFENE